MFDALGQRGRWLLVYDNAQQPADLEGLRPPGGGGQVLITSRNPAWGGVAATVWVDVLSRQEAVAFLQLRAGSGDQATLERLAAMLGDLPLALEQVAAYLEETVTTPAEYLELLHDHEPELFGLGRPTTSEQTIATTWTISLERLRVQAPAAEDLLVLCAFLAPDDIPRSLVADHAELLPERLARVAGDRLAYQQTIAALRHYSLLTSSPESLTVHRLVQAVVRQQLDAEQTRQWASSALRLVHAATPHDTDDPVWPVYAPLLAHMLAVSGDAAASLEPERTVTLLTLAGVWRLPALSRRVRPGAESTEARGPDRPGPPRRRRPHYRRSLNGLANVLHDQGDLAGARPLYERALAIFEASLGPDHPTTGQSLNYLATVLHDEGDLAGARRLHERALTIRQTSLAQTIRPRCGPGGILRRSGPP